MKTIKPEVNQNAEFYCSHCKKTELKPVGCHFEWKGTIWSCHANNYTHKHKKVLYMLECLRVCR